MRRVRGGPNRSPSGADEAQPEEPGLPKPPAIVLCSAERPCVELANRPRVRCLAAVARAVVTARRAASCDALGAAAGKQPAKATEPRARLPLRRRAGRLLARLGVDRRRCSPASRSTSGARHRWLLVGSTLAAAAGNTVAMVVPWREWLGDPPRPAPARPLVRRADRVRRAARRRRRLELLPAALPRGPVHRRRADRLAARLLARRQRGDVRGRRRARSRSRPARRRCGLRSSRPPSAVALVLARAIRREAAAHTQAAARAELERTLAKEANHRIKNDLQTVADLLLLGRPDGAGRGGIRRDGRTDPLDRDACIAC